MRRAGAIAFLILFTISAPLFAAPGAGGVNLPAGKWWRRPEVIARLHLSNEQQVRLDEVSRQSAKELIDLRAAVEKKTIDLRAELDGDYLDRERIHRAAAAVSDARARLFERELMMMVDLRAVLTAEQWDQLRAALRGEGRAGGQRRQRQR